jgi:hypothetical protein
MNLRALYVNKLAKCPLICPGGLVDDQKDKEKKRKTKSKE